MGLLSNDPRRAHAPHGREAVRAPPLPSRRRRVSGAVPACGSDGRGGLRAPSARLCPGPARPGSTGRPPPELPGAGCTSYNTPAGCAPVQGGRVHVVHRPGRSGSRPVGMCTRDNEPGESIDVSGRTASGTRASLHEVHDPSRATTRDSAGQPRTGPDATPWPPMVSACCTDCTRAPVERLRSNASPGRGRSAAGDRRLGRIHTPSAREPPRRRAAGRSVRLPGGSAG